MESECMSLKKEFRDIVESFVLSQNGISFKLKAVCSMPHEIEARKNNLLKRMNGLKVIKYEDKKIVDEHDFLQLQTKLEECT